MNILRLFLSHRPHLSIALAFFAAGCALFAPKRPEQFKVENSSLDALDILYLPDSENSPRKHPSRLTIFGSGQIRLRSGRSPLVIDSFATNTSDPDWNHYHQDNAGFHPEEITAVFQRLVNAGLVYSNITGPKSSEPPGLPRLQIAGKINGKKIVRVTDDPKLIAVVENILDWFAR